MTYAPLLTLFSTLTKLVVTGSAFRWRMLPKDFPPYGDVNYYYHKWMRDGTWDRILDELLKADRQKKGRDSGPSLFIADSQSVKSTSMNSDRGIDGGELINGRKRFIVVDVLGNIWGVLVTPANVSEKEGLKRLMQSLKNIPKRVKKLLYDQGVSEELKLWVKDQFSIELEIVKTKGKRFSVLPKRWIVERTFGWLNFFRQPLNEAQRSWLWQVWGFEAALLSTYRKFILL